MRQDDGYKLNEVIKKRIPGCGVVLANNTITADAKKRRSFVAMLFAAGHGKR